MTLDLIRNRASKGHYDTKIDYGSDKKAWREDRFKLELLFRQDLKKALESEGVPKEYSEGVVNYAWQEGHSSGYSEILVHAGDIAQMIFKC